MRRLLVPLLAVTLGSLACRRSETPPVEEIRFLMDTVVRVAVYDTTHDEATIHQAMDAAFQAMTDVERAASIHLPESEISALVRSAGSVPMALSPLMTDLLRQSVAVAQATDGAFDPTIGAVKTLWPFESESPAVPDSAAIAQAVGLVDYRQIQFTEDGVYLPREGMVLDLGGVAKGLAIDRGVAALRAAGMAAGIVDAGGDLRLFGKRPGSGRWGVGIRHPRGQNPNVLYAALRLDSLAVATSGDYERYFEVDGVRYHHLLDPQTGYPVHGAVSTTIVAPTALLADAWATAVFILGPEKGMALIEATPEIEGLILFEEDGALRRVVSSGLKGKIEF